ncbi:MAG: hypothetical protein M1822_009460 [Bathelium mastoideum]|nr:MAG: hypothetical protein M1822_009460 [Bathelium mastoideum]
MFKDRFPERASALETQKAPADVQIELGKLAPVEALLRGTYAESLGYHGPVAEMLSKLGYFDESLREPGPVPLRPSHFNISPMIEDHKATNQILMLQQIQQTASWFFTPIGITLIYRPNPRAHDT